MAGSSQAADEQSIQQSIQQSSSASHKQSQRCLFCNLEDDEKTFGPMVFGHGLAAHNFCLLFSSGLAQQGEDDEGLLGFLPADIRKEKARSSLLRCGYCKRKGASIGCTNQRCKKSFHYDCGRKNGAMYLYCDDFRSFCKNHRIQQEELTEEEKQTLGVTPPANDCLICYEPLVPAISDTTVRSPCCTRAWYHRTCLESMAYSAGLHFFKCPLCNNMEEWQAEMLRIGIYIPDRDASWELEPNAYNSLLETVTECEADECICPQGRREDKRDSIWELILCETCGSQACHTACGQLKRRDKEWLCKVCSSAVSSPEPKIEVRKLRKRESKKSSRRRAKAIKEVTNII